MTIKNFAAFVFLLTLAGFSSLWAQDPGVETRVMRLSWTKDDYALRYEVLIEKEEDGVYRNVHREFTQDFSVEIPLPEGNYRCSVIPYDLLDRPGQRSEWISMEVHVLLKPELSVTDIPDTPEPLAAEPETEAEEIIIADPPPEEKKKSVENYFGVAWMPIIPVHFAPEDQMFDEKPSLAGFGARLGFVSAKQSFLNPGLEVAFSYWHNSLTEHIFDEYAYMTGMTEQFTSKFYSFVFDINLVMQKYLSNRAFILSLQAGGGITFQYVSQSHSMSFFDGFENYPMWEEPDFRYYTQLNIGVSLIWTPRGSFYLEAGVDYSYLFTRSNPGFLRPRLGLGTRY